MSLARRVAFGLALVFASCRPAPATRDEPGPLRVDLAGCASARADACEIPDGGVVNAWVDAPPDASLAFATDRGPLSPRTSEVRGGGTLARLDVAGARELRVSARRPGVNASFTVRLAPAPKVAWLDEARALRAAGKLDEAEARLAPGLAAAPSEERARAVGLRARIERSRGHLDEAAALFREAIALDRAYGLVSDEANDSTALSFSLARQSRRYAEAREALDAAAPAFARYAEGASRADFYRGVIATETGEAREALRAYRHAQDEAARLGLDLDVQRARNGYALQLELVGRWRDALAELRALDRDAASGPTCDHVAYAINLGFGAILANEATASRAEDAIAPLMRARQLSASACPNAHEAATIDATLAAAELQRGDVSHARAHIEEARGHGELDGALLTWLLDLEGRAALAAGEHAAALAAFDREARAGAGATSPESRWRAAYGRGEALRRTGKTADALAAFARAEAVLDEATVAVPLGEGRGAFVVEREKSARSLVSLLVDAGRVDEASAVARHAQARVLASVARSTQIEGLAPEARARWDAAVGEYLRDRDAIDRDANLDWTHSRETLAAARRARAATEARVRASFEAALAGATGPMTPASVAAREPPPEGAVAITYARGDAGWLAFTTTTEGTRATRLGDVAVDAPPEALAAALFPAPVRSAISGARAVRLYVDAALASRDLHALPFDDAGAPLLATTAVEYGASLASARRPAPAGGAWLVVGDPLDDLPRARAEAQEVTGILQASLGDGVRPLIGAAATSGALRSALPGAEALHYAGHGFFAGREGWDSELPLAADGHLAIADVLALPSSPRLVVLSACDGAKAAAGDEPVGVGLAHAFLAAGSDVVVAATRPVADGVAERVIHGFYERLRGSSDAPSALRESELALREADPEADWSAFRVLRR